MDPERWSRIEDLFHRALTSSATQRADLLASECAGDDDLRQHVERLLAADERPHDLVDRFDDGALLPTRDPLIGRELGAYRLTERIAVGGMGVVYRAERTDGLFQRQVAIKLIRIELATENLVRRFELERRTLAALHHPSIAQLYDGGTTAEGRPYLVMELVRGTPIDLFCEERRLSIEERLRLFVQVCRAVHFAHQNLVVHRDLKPANILIDESGSPKLVDFGIARLLAESAEPSSLAPTLTGGHILTPDYASPEQLTLGPVTTAMDVYSLGVVLYELLTGRRPFRSDTASPIEWHRAVIERAPTRPSSTALWSTEGPAPDGRMPTNPIEVAARRRSTPRSVRRRLRGDLDRIVLMTLRKEPERRYASPKDLADDIERHIEGLPVQARADSLGYRSAKFVRRNRLGVASALIVVSALVFAVVSSRRGEREAREQALHARVEADSFQRNAEFLMDSFLASVADVDRDERRERILSRAAQLRREYSGQEHLRANLLDSLGQVAQRLGLFDDAEALVHEALEIRGTAFGERSLEYALSLRSLGRLRRVEGEFAAATEVLTRALALHRERTQETHTDVASLANDLASCWRELGRFEAADALFHEALELRRRAAEGSLEVAESWHELGLLDLERDDPELALAHLHEALAIRRRLRGDGDPITLDTLSHLAVALSRSGERERARALLEAVERGCRKLRVEGAAQLAEVLTQRSALLLEDRDYDAAAPLLAEVLEWQGSHLGATHPKLATTLALRARWQQGVERRDEARASWERALAIRRQAGASPWHLARALYEYGECQRTDGVGDASRDAFREALDVLHANDCTRGALRGCVELAYGRALLAQGEPAAAKPHLLEAVSILATAPAGTKRALDTARDALARCAAPNRD